MDAIMQQKKKGQQNFRKKYPSPYSQSPYNRLSDQFTPQSIQDLLSNLQGVCNNGKVNMQKLCQRLQFKEGSYSPKDLTRLLGLTKKQLKVSELHQLLKTLDLTSFDLQEQMMRYFFENGAFSLNKLDSVMTQLGLCPLNSKDRDILIQCFDFDRNKMITQDDLTQLVKLLQQSQGQQL